MNKIILLLTVLFVANIYSQEKKLWAKSFLNKKAPELTVEKWVTEKPNTKGKFILIDFWATWCGPCKKVIPELNDFSKKFKDQLVVIGITNEPKKVIKRMKDPKITYYNAIDTKQRLYSIYEIKGIPHCVIINPDGIVVWEGWPQQKGFELTEEVISNLLKS